MSLVADVLASVTPKSDASDSSVAEMEKLFKECEEAKVTICQALSSRYVELSSAFNQTQILEERLNACIQNATELDGHIRDEVIPSVEGSASEIGRAKLRWMETKKELEVTKTLLDIHSLLEESLSAQISEEFETAVIALQKVEALLNKAGSDEVASHLEIMSALREELVLKRTDLVYVAGESWDKFLSFSEEEESSSESQTTTRLLVRDIPPQDSDREGKRIFQMFSALHLLGELQGHIRPFAKTIFRCFVKPLLRKGSELKVSTQKDSGVSVMYVQASPEGSKIEDPSSAVYAIGQLEMLFRFLHGHLSRFSIRKSSQEVISLMSLLGAEIEEEFVELILNSCLEESVPSDRRDLKGFTEVQLKVEEFHDFLVSIDFYSKEHSTLLNYVANVETAYGNKTCSSILMRSRALIVKSLHVTASVGMLEPGGPLVAQDAFGKELPEATARLKNLSPNSFNIPKCKVSVSVCELVNLLYSTMDEACSSVPEFAVRLFHCVRSILTLYLHVTPVAHAQKLSSSHECAALVHNNGMFVAHHALLLGHHYQSKFPVTSQEISLTTADIGFLIRASACEVFLKRMQGHKNFIIDTLKKGMESSLMKSDLTSSSPLHSSVQECLRLLQKVQEGWQPVLPRSVYIKSMGTLAGSLVEELVSGISGLEEISADDAISLVNALSQVTGAVPPLLAQEEEEEECTTAAVLAPRHVRLWEKMKELRVVLAASLRDLDERWSAGKGPLALHFTPGELKHLVKAIFQNTERRAKLLSRIK